MYIKSEDKDIKKRESNDMSSEVRNEGKNPAVLQDNDYIRWREADLFYRNPVIGISSDSADSSLKNSYGEELDQMLNDPLPRSSSHDPSPNDIIDQLSKLKVCEEDNRRSADAASENHFRGHSIIVRNVATESIYHRTVHSLPELTSSVILASGFNEKKDIEGELSLLNVAIDESNESSSDAAVLHSGESKETDPDRSRNEKSFCNVDSLELERERRSIVVEKDSLDSEACYAGCNAAGETSMESLDQENVVKRFGALNKQRSVGKPIVISDQTANLNIKVMRGPDDKRLLVFDEKNVVFKDKNDNIRQDLNGSDTRGEVGFSSLANHSEIRATANIKTPNLKSIHFIEDCCKSTPAVGVMADTFGSEFVSDIMSLSMLGENENAKAETSSSYNQETSCCRGNIIKKFSQRFVQAPIEFTGRLIAVLEESVLHSKPGDNNTSGISLCRLTEEFRKICRGHTEYSKRIEDESMPDVGSFEVSTASADESWKKIDGKEEATNLPAQSFTSFGGGRKVYRKTPRRIIKSCNSPNCANIFHRVENVGSDSVRYLEASRNLDDTATFVLWEKLCYEMSPTKQPRYHSPRKNSSDVLSHEDFIRKSDRQMATLDQSFASPSKLGGREELVSDGKNSDGTWKVLRDGNYSVFMATENNDSNKSSEGYNCTKPYDDLEKIQDAHLVQKRRKCFEEASKLSAKAPATTVRNKLSEDSSCETIFISTLSACFDYLDDFKRLNDHKHSLQCIAECSEESMISETTRDGKSLKCVEAVIIPVRSSAQHQIRHVESSNPQNDKSTKVAEAYIDLSGSLESSAMFDGQLQSMEESFQAMSNHQLSLGTCSPSFVSKKIKRSVSPKVRRSLKGAILESRSNLSQPPGITGSKGEEKKSEEKRKLTANLSAAKSSPHFPSNKSKSAADSPGLMDITNVQKSNYPIPKLLISRATPTTNDSTKKSNYRRFVDENTNVDCKMALEFSATETPEQKNKKYFYTPGKTPALAKVKPKKKYFETPRRTPTDNKLPTNSPSTPGSHRFNYNTVLSPVGMYIRGTNPNLIKNVRAKTNERMLTPRSKTAGSKSNAVSPILARSPRLSPRQTEPSRLKFKLSTPRKPAGERAPDILNVALCESDPSTSTETQTSPFPKIFYKPAPRVKMVNDSSKKRYEGPKNLAKAVQEKIVYRHEGRLNSARRMDEQYDNRRDDDAAKNSLPSVSGDVSLWHKRKTVETQNAAFFLHDKNSEAEGRKRSKYALLPLTYCWTNAERAYPLKIAK